MAKVSLLDVAVSYTIANDLGGRLYRKRQYEEAKEIHLAVLEGRRRVLGEERKDTCGSLNNMGSVLHNMKDYEGALDYYQQDSAGGLGKDTS